MNILLVCDRYPYPLHDGLVLRIYHYVRQLGGRHVFDLVCHGTDAERRPEVERLFRRVEVIPREVAGRPSGWRRIRSALNPDELYPQSQNVSSLVRQAVDAGSYDVLWDAGCNMLLNLADVRGKVPLFADQVDDTTLRMVREFRLARGLVTRLRKLKELFVVRRFERKHLCNAATVLFVSELDAESFSRLCPNTEVAVVANGVDPDYFAPGGELIVPGSLVFEGSMAFPPNIDGAVWFAREVFPLIKDQVPEAMLSIVGRDPAPEVRALAASDVEVTGSVPDVRPYLARAAVFVCPMRSGAGIKNKILQAWAMGKAVVTTPEGAAGLDYEDGGNLLVRVGGRALADAVVELLRDPDRAAQLGRRGRETVLARYSWAAKAEEFDAVLRRAAGQELPTSQPAGGSRHP